MFGQIGGSRKENVGKQLILIKSSLDCQGSAKHSQFGSLKALSNLSSLSGFHQILLDIIQRSQSFIITAVFVFIMIVVVGVEQLYTSAAVLAGQDQLPRSCVGL